MQVFDELTKRWMSSRNCTKIVIQQLPKQIIFGYTSKPDRVVKVLIASSEGYSDYFETDLNLYKGKLLYSKRKGVYFSPIHYDEDFILTEQLIKGSGDFPYILLESMKLWRISMLLMESKKLKTMKLCTP